MTLCMLQQLLAVYDRDGCCLFTIVIGKRPRRKVATPFGWCYVATVNSSGGVHRVQYNVSRRQLVNAIRKAKQELAERRAP